MIVVTGGAGLIGSHIIERLNVQGISDILVSDRLDASGKWRNLDRNTFADYVDKDQLFDAMGKSSVEAVIHMGAITDTMEMDAQLVVEYNFQYSKEIWRWCTEHRTMLVYASSASVYGDGSQGFSETVDLGSVHALNPYAYSKLLFDRWVMRQSGAKPPHWRATRFFNVYGSGEAHKGRMASVVLHAMRQLHREHKVQLFKAYRDGYRDGEQLRDFVQVDDTANVVVQLAKDDSLEDGFYNVGTGQARTFNDLATAVCRAMGRESNIEYVDMPEGLEQRYQYFTQADVTKLRRNGLLPHPTSLEDGITDYVAAWLQEG